MISWSSGGSTRNADKFLEAMIRGDQYSRLEGLARRGVDALRSATPTDTGVTAAAWSYRIERKSSGVTIWWENSHKVDGFPVAIGLQYGHGTGTGGWVAGEDYINPALKPIFKAIADEVWREVQRA